MVQRAFRRGPTRFLLAALSALPPLATAMAQTTGSVTPVFVKSAGDLTVTGNFIGELSSVNSINTGFGAGSFNAAGERKRNDVAAIEYFLKPQLVALYDPGPYNVYSRVSASIAGTFLGGDAYFPTNLTDNTPFRADWEEALVGLRSGYSFQDWGLSDAPDLFDLSYGAQDFYVGDGFLIQQGSSNGGKRGAFWAGIRTAFERAAILRINGKPFRADLFDLKTSASQKDFAFPSVGDYPRTQITGVNLEYFNDFVKDGVVTKSFVYGATLLHVRDADDSATFPSPSGASGVPLATGGASRNGLNVVDARAQGTLIHDQPELFLSGEFVYENNPTGKPSSGGFNRRVDAKAWYVEAAWNFSHWAPFADALAGEPGVAFGHPRVGYRYAHFDGQKPGRNVQTAYDPLAYGYSYAASRNVYGTWNLGEIIGEYYLFNTNENVHMVYVAEPLSYEWTTSLFLYHFSFDEPPSASVTSKSAFEEADLEVDYYPAAHPWFGLTGIFGVARTLDGGKQYVASTVGGINANAGDPRAARDVQGLAEFLIYLNF